MIFIPHGEEKVLGRNLFMSKNNNHTIDASKLRRRPNGQIDWESSIGFKIPFTFNEIKGELLIMSYSKKSKEQKALVTVKYLNEPSIAIEPCTLLKGCISKVIGIRNVPQRNYIFKISDTIQKASCSIKIIDRKHTRRSNGSAIRKYNYICNKCKHTAWIEEHDLKKMKDCPCCGGHNNVTINGKNTINITAPWMINYLKNKTDAYKYKRCSRKKVDVICPFCKRECQSMLLSNLFKSHSVNCICNDHVSFAEKYIFNLLKYIDCQYIWQYSKKNASWCGNKRYDFYIYKVLGKDCNIILEVNGQQHEKETDYFRRSLPEEIYNDSFKKTLALSKGHIKMEDYIQIFFPHNITVEKIKDIILSSELASLLHIVEKDIDWIACFQQSLSNIYNDICDYKLRFPHKTTVDIANEFQMDSHTVLKALRGGGIYSELEEKAQRYKKIRTTRGFPILVTTPNGNKIFRSDSATQLSLCSKEILNTHIDTGTILKYAKNNTLYKGYLFSLV